MLYSTKNLKKVCKLLCHSKRTTTESEPLTLEFLSDCKTLVSSGIDKSLRFWNPLTKK